MDFIEDALPSIAFGWTWRLRALAFAMISVSLPFAVAAQSAGPDAGPAGSPQALERPQIVPAVSAQPQGAGADLILGPGNRVWGFDGAYGCGGVIPQPVVGVTCNLFSVNLDGSDYRLYPIPPSVTQKPAAGRPPVLSDFDGFPKRFAAFYFAPKCNCEAEYPYPGRPTGNMYNDLTLGSDGNVWFTSMGQGGVWIGKMTPRGELTVYPMADFLKASGRTDNLTNPSRPSWEGRPFAPQPWDIESGPDGRIYFSVADSWAATLHTNGPADRRRVSWIGSFKPEDPIGTLKTWSLPSMAGPLIFGPDHNLWFATHNKFYSQEAVAVVGRLDIKTGGMTTWRMPAVNNFVQPRDPCCASWTSNYIQFDPLGRLWYTIEFVAGIGRFDPKDGSFTFFTEGHGGEGVFGSSVIEIGNDGLIYKLTTPTGDVLQIDLDGRVLQRIKNPKPSFALALRKMPDGTLWMTDHLRANIQKVVGIPDLRRTRVGMTDAPNARSDVR